MFDLVYLNECFYLNKETWELHWKYRPENHFTHMRYANRFNSMYSGKEAGHIFRYNENLRYKKVKLNHKNLLVHRVIWTLYFNSEPDGIIDHIDGNGINNNINNLRVCNEYTDYNNSRNRVISVNNTSGRTGVYWRKERNKWVAKGRVYNKEGGFKNYWLGSYDKYEDAVLARESWENENNFIFRE